MTTKKIRTCDRCDQVIHQLNDDGFRLRLPIPDNEDRTTTTVECCIPCYRAFVDAVLEWKYS